MPLHPLKGEFVGASIHHNRAGPRALRPTHANVQSCKNAKMWNSGKLWKILEKFWKNSGKILEKFWKNSGKSWKNSGKILEQFWKILENPGKFRKILENSGNPGKILEKFWNNSGKSWEILENSGKFWTRPELGLPGIPVI